MKPSGISRRELIKQMGYCSMALAFASRAFNPENRSRVTFVDVAARAGIAFRHDNASSTEKYLIETMGSGCGWIDYDQNGLLDLYLVNGAATRLTRPSSLCAALFTETMATARSPTSPPRLASAPKDFSGWA